MNEFEFFKSDKSVTKQYIVFTLRACEFCVSANIHILLRENLKFVSFSWVACELIEKSASTVYLSIYLKGIHKFWALELCMGCSHRVLVLDNPAQTSRMAAYHKIFLAYWY